MSIQSAEQIEEERAKQEKQRRDAQDAAREAEKPGILEAIMGFIKFLFETFFTGAEAPNEGGQAETPDTPSRITQMGRLIMDANAIPKWREFQEKHSSETVIHQSPVRGDSQVTSNFGHRHAPTAGASTDHKGLDLGARGDSSIVASADGVVLFSGKKSGYGNTVIIGHADGTYTLYGHMTGAEMPQTGVTVAQGEKIGVMGASGTATGVHLHYEQRKGTSAINPIIQGRTFSEGMALKGAGAPRPSQFASLDLPADMPKLPTAEVHENASPLVIKTAPRAARDLV